MPDRTRREFMGLTAAGAAGLLAPRWPGASSTPVDADFVVLADDPHTVRVDRIKDIAIVRTVVGGSITHQA